ncbi:conserved protein of unknown function [Limnospira indica PCC 8005]|uniref:Uncharacterized protein n=1 Tax=Limnospira indica PCC 8005 TaxID=376219 RepID=A0A9P1KLL9_9CYAN|nr:conserved protein of unknown function [Limnospira indica PCC 8005]
MVSLDGFKFQGIDGLGIIDHGIKATAISKQIGYATGRVGTK